jgi:hypothetical protein
MRDTIELAREAGIDAEKDTLCRYEGWLEPLKAFEALVRADERKSFCAALRQMHDAYSLASDPAGLKVRGNI